MKLQSSAFAQGKPIPDENARDHADHSPALSWSGAPESTKSFALVCDDPDAPRGTWVHWVYFDIPASLAGLPEGVDRGERPKTGGVQGKNDYGDVGWGGPQPPRGHGIHRSRDRNRRTPPRPPARRRAPQDDDDPAPCACTDSAGADAPFAVVGAALG